MLRSAHCLHPCATPRALAGAGADRRHPAPQHAATVGLGLFSGVFEEKAPTPAWQEYQLQKALGAQTDYLACECDALCPPLPPA